MRLAEPSSIVVLVLIAISATQQLAKIPSRRHWLSSKCHKQFHDFRGGDRNKKSVSNAFSMLDKNACYANKSIPSISSFRFHNYVFRRKNPCLFSLHRTLGPHTPDISRFNSNFDELCGSREKKNDKSHYFHLDNFVLSPDDINFKRNDSWTHPAVSPHFKNCSAHDKAHFSQPKIWNEKFTGWSEMLNAPEFSAGLNAGQTKKLDAIYFSMELDESVRCKRY